MQNFWHPKEQEDLLVPGVDGCHSNANALDLPPRGDLPTVSVVVPCFNSARYLADRLRSILWQNWPIAEIIILDDASTDGSLAEISRFKSEWGGSVRVVVSAINSGSACGQWQNAMSHVRGDLVWIAEADDVAHPNFLASLVPAFGDPSIVLAYVNTMIIDDTGAVLHGDTRPWLGGSDPSIWDRAFTMNGRNFLADLLAPRNVIINASGVLLRGGVLTDALRHLQGRLSGFRTAGDWLVYAECLRRGRVFYTPDTFNACRRHAGSVSFNLDPKAHFLETLEVQAYILDAIQAQEDVVSRAVTAAMYLANYLGLDGETALEAIHEKFRLSNALPSVGD